MIPSSFPYLHSIASSLEGLWNRGNNNPVIFDGTPNSQRSQNAPCNWTKFVTVASISIQNGYNQILTINNNLVVEDAGSLTVDANPSSKLSTYIDTGAVLQVDGGGTITNMNLGGDATGEFVLDGGTMIMSPASSFGGDLWVNFIINPGAIVNYQSNNQLGFDTDDITITVKGEMDIYYGPRNGMTLIGNGIAFTHNYIDVDGGFLGYYGRQNVKDTISVPILVQNGGTFSVSVSSNSGKPLQGTLIVQGANASTNNVSVYMTGASSSVQLAFADTLECDNGYYQDSGALETTNLVIPNFPPQPCVLQAGPGAAGTVTIAGGTVAVNTSGFGPLNVLASTLNFNGALEVAIDATNQANKGSLNVSGTTNLQANSTLTVYVQNGQPAPNQQWIVIKDNLGNNIRLPAPNFQMPIITVPGSNLDDKLDPSDNTQYIVTS